MAAARRATWLAILLLGTGNAAARAENLAEAWRIVLSGNPQLQAQRLNAGAAGVNLAAAQRGYLPRGSATALDVQFLSPPPRFGLTPGGTAGQGIGTFGTSVFPFFSQNNLPFVVTSLNQPVYAGGRVRRQVDAAGAQLSQQQAGRVRTALDLKLAVAEAYIGVLQSKRNLEVAKSDVTRLESFLSDVRNRQRVGMATRNEQLSAEVSLANARLREIQTRNAQSIARATYNRYMLRPLEALVQIDDLGPPPSAARFMAADPTRAPVAAVTVEEQELVALTEQAMRIRPELAQLSGRARELIAQAQVTRATTKPTVNVGINYIYAGFNTLNNRDIWAATAVGTWNFYDGGTARRQAQAQEQQSQAAMRQRADQAAAIALEVRTRWLNLTEARERIEVSRVAVAQADENVNVVQDRYRQQLSTYTEVLDAEAQRVQAYANFHNATYDAALAWFRLHRAVGDL